MDKTGLPEQMKADPPDQVVSDLLREEVTDLLVQMKADPSDHVVAYLSE